MNTIDKKQVEFFKEITQENLPKLNLRYYGAGKELKVGDLVIFGHTIRYANLNGVATSTYTDDEASNINLLMFVLDQNTNLIHQLYDKK